MRNRVAVLLGDRIEATVVNTEMKVTGLALNKEDWVYAAEDVDRQMNRLPRFSSRYVASALFSSWERR